MIRGADHVDTRKESSRNRGHLMQGPRGEKNEETKAGVAQFGAQDREWHEQQNPISYGKEFGVYFTCNRENLESIKQGNHRIQYPLFKRWLWLLCGEWTWRGRVD